MAIIVSYILYGLLYVTFLLFLALCACFLKIYSGKSVGDSDYPPVKGTMFNLFWNIRRLHDHQADVAATQKTVRYLALSHSEIFTTHPPNIEHIVKTNFSHYDKGPYHQEIMKDLLGDGIFVVDGEKWRSQRKIASYEFSTKVLRDFSCAVFRYNAAALAEKIFEMAKSDVPMDIHDLFTKFAMDSIFEVGFGLKLNILNGSNDEATRFSKAFDDSNAFTFPRYFNMFWKINKFLNVGMEARFRENIKVVDEFIYKLITSKRQELFRRESSYTIKEDILSRFLLDSEKNPGSMTDQYLRDIILNFLIAGKDTTAGTLSWFIYMLCKQPLIQEKVRQEIRETVGPYEDEKFSEFSAKITEASLEKMHYLHAALTEMLRLCPAVPVDRKSALCDDILPDGFKVKKGDGISYIAYAMGRMKYIWGEDAEDFLPERWLCDGIFKPESPSKFPAFHGDPCVCLGKDFAYRQMKIAATVLVAFFTFKLADPHKEVTYKTKFTLHMNQGLRVRAIAQHRHCQGGF